MEVYIIIHNIERKSQIKYLGVYIDQNLHWGSQIQNIKKLVKNIGIINKLRYYVDLLILKQFHFSLIYPYLTYGIASWGNVCNIRLRNIKTKQNKCVRSLFFASDRDNAMPYFNFFRNSYNWKHLQIQRSPFHT